MKKLTLQSTFGEALKNPRAVAVAERISPGITRNPARFMVSRLPLIRLTQSRRANMTLEQLNALLKEINGD